MKTAVFVDNQQSSHFLEGHPENPNRILGALSLIEESNLDIHWVTDSPLQNEDLHRVHSQSYINFLQKRSGELSFIDNDTYVSINSFEIAKRASGGLITISKEVLEGSSKNGFCLSRPPGHHALPETGMGFCILSNLAIAVRWVQAHYDVSKILVVDFDVHHGNGTQEVFSEDDSVLFISIHQRPPFYPNSGHLHETGSGKGEGYTINIPLLPGTGDEGYKRIFEEILSPLVARFQPDIIFVSAGYDAHWLDPLGGMKLSHDGFNQIIKTILEWGKAYCSERVIMNLEGGYHIEATSIAIQQTLCLLSQSDEEMYNALGVAPFKEIATQTLIETLKTHFKI